MVAKLCCERTSCLKGVNTRLLNYRHFFLVTTLELYRFYTLHVWTLFIANKIDLSVCSHFKLKGVALV